MTVSSAPGAEDLFWARMGELRGRVCDGRFCAPLTFLKEDRRTAAFEDALAQNDIPQILSLFAASGRSSQQLLQNAWPDAKPEERGLCLALALSSHLLQDKGACGSTAADLPGSILSFVPQEMADFYRQRMEAVFGLGSCRQLYIRPAGRRGNFVVADEISPSGERLIIQKEFVKKKGFF